MVFGREFPPPGSAAVPGGLSNDRRPFIKRCQHGLQGAAVLRPEQAIGLSRRGWTTKVVAVVDEAGLLCGALLAPGNQQDQTASRALLPALAATHFWGDKGFASEVFRAAPHEAGVAAMTIPRRGCHTIAEQPAPFDAAVCAQRHKVENIFQRLKLHKRLALRADKTASSQQGFPVFVALLDRLLICKDTAQSGHDGLMEFSFPRRRRRRTSSPKPPSRSAA